MLHIRYLCLSPRSWCRNPDNLIVRIWIWLVQRVLCIGGVKLFANVWKRLNKKQLAKNAILPRHPNRRVEMQCIKSNCLYVFRIECPSSSSEDEGDDTRSLTHLLVVALWEVHDACADGGEADKRQAGQHTRVIAPS
jgi:hypothetical protein